MRSILKYDRLYAVTKGGDIWSYRSNRFLKKSKDTDGYNVVGLTDSLGNLKTCKVHRLVALTYISNPTHKPQINHINGIKTDNRIDNLEWCSSAENIIHARLTGLISTINPNAKINKSDAITILNLKGLMTQKEIASMFNIGRSQVANIHCHISWGKL